MNSAGQVLPGVKRELLSGLSLTDAEEMIKACGVTGDSRHLQEFMQTNCDCHPLVIGVLAGLINDYHPDRGNFDRWVEDSEGGASLNLAELTLIQRRNHILETALKALPDSGRQLLSTLSLLSEAVDYETIAALNPSLPPKPENLKPPQTPEESYRWDLFTDEERRKVRVDYATERASYERDLKDWMNSGEVRKVSRELTDTISHLEKSGLLQYDKALKHYDLHPVVRGVAAGGLRQKQKEALGQRVVDHFSQKAHIPYEEAETLKDISDALQVIRTLQQLGHFEQAFETFCNGPVNALLFKLSCDAEMLSILRPHFLNGWSKSPKGLSPINRAYAMGMTASVLANLDQVDEAIRVNANVIKFFCTQKLWESVSVRLRNMVRFFAFCNKLAKYGWCVQSGIQLSENLSTDHQVIWLLSFATSKVRIGRSADAEILLQKFNSMPQPRDRGLYRIGSGEMVYCFLRFRQGKLTIDDLDATEMLNRQSRDREGIIECITLRGLWHYDKGEWKAAHDNLQEAVKMLRENGKMKHDVEAQFALAGLKLGHRV